MAATSCCTFCAGTAGLTSTASGSVPTMPMASKLLAGSYEVLAPAAGLSVKVELELISSV